MAATATGSAQQTKATQILESDAFQDFMATEIGGQSKAARAKDRGITPSTVSANVKRVQEAIDSGLIENPRDGSTTVPGKAADRKDIAENILEGSSMFVESLDKIDSEHKRIEGRVTQMQEQLSDLDGQRGKIRDLATKAGFNWDEYDAQVAAAESGTDDGEASS